MGPAVNCTVKEDRLKTILGEYDLYLWREMQCLTSGSLCNRPREQPTIEQGTTRASRCNIQAMRQDNSTSRRC